MAEKNATLQQIYQCAPHILEADGPLAVSMRRVAKEVGIAAMAMQRMRFVSMVAAYPGTRVGDVEILSVSQTNSSRSIVLIYLARNDPTLQLLFEAHVNRILGVHTDSRD
jgi:hypothetical protein